MNGLKDLDGLKGSAVRELAVINSRVPPEAFERIRHGLLLQLGQPKGTKAAARLFDSTVLEESTNSFEEYHRDRIRTHYVRYDELRDAR